MARNVRMREPGNTYSDVLHPETNSAQVLSPDGLTTVYAQIQALAPLSHVGATGSAHGLVTGSVAGFMSSSDKSKLDSIASGAQVNQTVTAGAGMSFTATSGDVTVAMGTPTTLTTGTTNTASGTSHAHAVTFPVTSVASKTGAVTLAASDVGLGNVTNESKATMFTNAALTGTSTAITAAVGTNTTQIATTAFVNAEIANDAAPIGHVGATGSAHGLATGSVNGFMSSSDFSKLSGIDTDANNYVHPATSGNKHIPSGGATGNILGWSSDGTAVWQAAPSAGVWGAITGTLSNQTDLNTALNGKADSSHNHDSRYYTETEIQTGTIPARFLIENANGVPSSNLGTPTIAEMALFETQFSNKTEFFDITKVSFQTSTDGSSWSDYTVSDTEKRRFVGGDTNSNVYIPYGTAYFRVRLTAVSYCYINAVYAYTSTNGHSTQIHTYKQHDSGSYTAHTTSTQAVSSWPGHFYVPIPNLPWRDGGTLNTHYDDIYVVFIPSWNETYPSNNINLYNLSLWGGYPAGKRRVYGLDEYANASFPAAVSGTRLTSTIATGTAPLTVTSTTAVTNLNADLLDGLHSTDFAASSHVGATGTAHGLATGSVNGFISSSDFSKLAGIAANANNYSHPNHTGDVTSTGDGVTVIGANKVTLAMMATMATDSFLGRDTAGTGNVEVLSVATVKTLLGLVLTDTANATGFSITGGTTSKTLTVSNTLTLAGTDSSTLNIGSGGTLGTAAFTASTAYATAAQGTTADNAIPKSVFTANNDFLIGSGAGTYAKKTVAETQTILGLGSAAYTASTAYATSAQGTLAGTALQPSLVTAANDFLVGTANGVVAKKTLAETQTILGLGSAAYTASTAYATAAQGTLAGTALQPSLVTEANDFLVGTGSGVVAKKTLAETKTILGLVLTDTANATGFSVAGGTTPKTLTVSNTLTLAGTDSSTLNIGTGGTLGTAAFTASTAYQAAGNELTALQALADTAGFVKKTGDGAYSIDTTTYGTSNLAVADLSGTAETLGGSAVVGVATTAARSDHKHAITNPAIDTLAAATDITTLNASTSAHGLVVKATAPAAGMINFVGIANAETAYTNKALFDATVPVINGTAAAGTATVAARRDHVHPTDTTRASTSHASTHVTGGSDIIANVVAAGNSGLMTGADKTKLDGIASGAQVNQNSFSNVAVSGQTTVAADSATDTLTLVAGTNMTITTDAATDTITINSTGGSSLNLGPYDIAYNSGNGKLEFTYTA